MIERAEAAATPAASGSASASKSVRPDDSRALHEARDRGLADPAPRAVHDAQQRARVGRVHEDGEVRGRVADLRALVEARAADDLVRDVLPHEHVLEHARLRVRPVEDRDLARGPAARDEARDLGRDEARLRVLVLDLDHAHRLPLAELGEEVLRLPLAVVVDDRVGRAEDRVGRAVVLLQGHDARAREVLLELDDVADIGRTEAVDRLVPISDGADIAVLRAQELEQAVLGVVRVLVLVDEDVAERALPLLARFRETLQRLNREHEHVVEVDRVRGVQAALVDVVRLRDRLVPERGDARERLVRRHELVLHARDLRVDPARREALRVLAELLQARLRQPHLVIVVVDRERRAVAQALGFAAQDAAAGGVEGEDPDRARGDPEHAGEAVAHLPGGLVRERDREDLVRLHLLVRDQMRDAVREDACLPRARAGDDEQRPLGGADRLELGLVEAVQEAVGGRDGDPSMLAARVGGSVQGELRAAPEHPHRRGSADSHGQRGERRREEVVRVARRLLDPTESDRRAGRPSRPRSRQRSPAARTS